MFSTRLWVALWSGVSPHAVDVQTDALCPQCICKNTLKPGFSWKTKPHSQTQHVIFFFLLLPHVRAHLCFHDRAALKSITISSPFQVFLSAPPRFRGVHHTVRRTECNQLLLLFSSPFQGHSKPKLRGRFPRSPPEHIWHLSKLRETKTQWRKEWSCSNECVCAFESFQHTR